MTNSRRMFRVHCVSVILLAIGTKSPVDINCIRGLDFSYQTFLIFQFNPFILNKMMYASLKRTDVTHLSF